MTQRVGKFFVSFSLTKVERTKTWWPMSWGSFCLWFQCVRHLSNIRYDDTNWSLYIVLYIQNCPPSVQTSFQDISDILKLWYSLQPKAPCSFSNHQYLVLICSFAKANELLIECSPLKWTSKNPICTEPFLIHLKQIRKSSEDAVAGY